MARPPNALGASHDRTRLARLRDLPRLPWAGADGLTEAERRALVFWRLSSSSSPYSSSIPANPSFGCQWHSIPS
eukprot:6644281-Pyramimonas_sp.AAC.1